MLWFFSANKPIFCEAGRSCVAAPFPTFFLPLNNVITLLDDQVNLSASGGGTLVTGNQI